MNNPVEAPENPARGFQMPPEWHPQVGTWVSWPHNADTWPKNLAAAQQEFVSLVELLATDQPVFLMGAGDEILRQARAALGGVKQVEFVNIATNDAWVRDYAPTFVHCQTTKRPAAVDWHYNAWGGKYPPYDHDQKVAAKIAEFLGIDCFSVALCLEGGAIEVNGAGDLLTTRSCVLNSNRNPGTLIEDVEQTLRKRLGSQRIIWIRGGGIEGDDTDGHIDQLARFVDDETIVYAWTDNARDPQRAALARNLKDLRGALIAHNLNYRLVPLPLPNPVYFDNVQLPASYCNFVVTNSSVIVPQFGDSRNDAFALTLLQSLAPNRQVFGLPSNNLSVGLGSFHCLTQQQPSF